MRSTLLLALAISCLAGICITAELPRFLGMIVDDIPRRAWVNPGLCIGPNTDILSYEHERFADTICVLIEDPSPGQLASSGLESVSVELPRWASRSIASMRSNKTRAMAAIGWPFRSALFVLRDGDNFDWISLSNRTLPAESWILPTGFVLNSILYAIVLLPLVLVVIFLGKFIVYAFRLERAKSRRALMNCPVCGYNLYKNESGECPECGFKDLGNQASSK